MMMKAKTLMLVAGLCMVSTLASASDTYRVSGVAKWDTLNMRSNPGGKSPVVGQIPADADGITVTGKQQSVGKTVWKEIAWNGKQGWVSQAYLASASVSAGKPDKAEKQDKAPVSQAAVAEKAPTPEPTQRQVPMGGVREAGAGTWILECGSASPYWKVEVLPEWMNLYTPSNDGGVPIQYKHQEKGKWSNAASKTELRGHLGASAVEMTLTYTGRCSSSLARKRVPFSVSGVVNGAEVNGCCRSMQVH